MSTFDQRALDRERRLHAAAIAAGHAVTGDNRVHEDAAAALLGVAAGTLRRWRALGEGPDLYRIGGRVSYSLHDLACFVESQRVTAAQFAAEGDG